MVYCQQYHHGSHYQHYTHPSLDSCLMTHCIRGTGHSAEVFQQPPSQPYQTAGCHNLGDVIESSLPADVLCLFLFIQLGHVHAVRSHIVRSAAESDNRQQKNGKSKKERKVQCKGDQCEPRSRNQLRQYDEEFLRLEHLEKRTPKKLQCPGKHYQRGPQSYLGITHSQPLEHKYGHHVQHHKGKSHGEINGWNPIYRIMIIPAHICFVAISTFYFRNSLSGISGSAPIVSSSVPPFTMS